MHKVANQKNAINRTPTYRKEHYIRIGQVRNLNTEEAGLREVCVGKRRTADKGSDMRLYEHRITYRRTL